MAVTAIMVYQNSQPWFEVALRSLLAYDPGHPLRLLLVENPCHDDSPRVARSYLLQDTGATILQHPQQRDRFGGGENHADALQYALPHVRTEWTLFLDADIVFTRDGWLAEMLAQNGDIVGPPAFGNLYDTSVPHAHPCLLLFRTKLIRPPRWGGSLRPTPGIPVGHRQYRDTCIAFTMHAASHPANTLRQLPMTHEQSSGLEYYRIAEFALHMRGVSNVGRRPRRFTLKQALLDLQEVADVCRATCALA